MAPHGKVCKTCAAVQKQNNVKLYPTTTERQCLYGNTCICAYGDELREMGFKAGEIADLKEAVKEWAVARA